ncbi:hypothetical protein LXL04_014789 [Taraxacum kok-saghyz]
MDDNNFWRRAEMDGNISERRMKEPVERRNNPDIRQTFAGTDKEKPIWSDRAIVQINYWPGMPMAYERNCDLLLIHNHSYKSELLKTPKISILELETDSQAPDLDTNIHRKRHYPVKYCYLHLIFDWCDEMVDYRGRDKEIVEDLFVYG